MLRVLVTGSRDWYDRAAVERALRDVAAGLYPEEVTVVHGDCPYGGADIIAAEIAAGWGCAVEAYPAEMGADGHVLGPARNQRMVDLGADICLAFPDSKSRGTWDCVRRAEKAGIPVSIDYSYVPLPENPLRWVRESGTGRLVQVAWSPHPHLHSDKEPHP